MRVLGVSCFYHDAAAALLVDGQLVAAAEEERFSRVKHDYEFPARAIQFCLDRAGIRGEDLDLVVFYEKPFWKFDRILMSALGTFPRSAVAFREAMLVWLLDKLWARDILQERIGCARDRIAFCPHHMSHAASAFYCSDFDASAVLTVDGVGEWATATRGTAWDTRIQLDEEMRYPHSLGLLYSAFTAFLGFQVNEGEYKVMGMAPYGEPRFTDLIFDKLVDLREDGSFRLDMGYFAYHYSAYESFNARFAELFGRPRTKEESNLLDPHYADVAASIQRAAEEILVRQATWLRRKTGHDNLCMAGGVALNSVANARILRESGFRKLYIQPAAGDGGGALGAALWGYHQVLGQPRCLRLRHCYWGQEHDDAAVAGFLRSQGHQFTELADMDAVYGEVAQRLAQGQVVGWVQGRFEWGPRALGARSILADPRAAHMKDVVNARIKFREPFRPFAPSVLAERVEDYFDLPGAVDVDPARFMLLVVPVREDRKADIPAVTHVDGTARIQSVHAAESPLYHGVISRFAAETGVPVVLNTSFNLRGEPIVNTPEEAFSTFSRSDMDALVMGRFLVSRRAAGEGRLVPGAELEKWTHAPSRTGEAPPAPEPLPARPAARLGRAVASALGKAAVVLLVSFLVLEVYVRWFVPIPSMQVRGMYVQEGGSIHLAPGWKGRVHTSEFDAPIAIGEDALRDLPAVQAPKRILALGDSFTFGCWSPVERTWLARMQQALGGRVAVVNGGSPNYGTDAELALLRRRGDEWKPDALLLAFFAGNDFYDNMVGRDAFTLEAGYLVMKDRDAERWGSYNCLSAAPALEPREIAGTGATDATPAPPPSGTSWYRVLLRRSHFYQYVRQTLAALGERGRLRPYQAEAWFLKDYRPEMEEALVATAAALDGVAAEARRRGIPLVVVIIPSQAEVYDDRWEGWLQSNGFPADLFDRGKPRRFVLEWAASRGVPALDLLDSFRGRERMYYEKDMHWNDLGHLQAGEKAAEFLQSAGLVEAP